MGDEVAIAVNLAFSTAGFILGVILMFFIRNRTAPLKILLQDPVKVEVVKREDDADER